MDAEVGLVKWREEHEGATNSEHDKATLDSTKKRCSCDSLPSELLARVFELVTKSAWKDGMQATPSMMEMSTFPGQRLDCDYDGEDELEIDGSFPIHHRPCTLLNALLNIKMANLDGRNISYPNVFSIVCSWWHFVALDTPSLWSYLSITDDSSLDEISLSLQRSNSFPLSIHITVLSKMTDVERVANQVASLKFDMERLKNQVDGLTSRILGREDLMASYGPITDEPLDPLALFEEKISLLLQHAGRWRCFHIIAAQPLFIHQAMGLFAKDDREAPLLEFYLKTSRSRRDSKRSDITLEREFKPKFIGARPSLQKLALCWDICPLKFRSDLNTSLLQPMLPDLRELELAQMRALDQTLCLAILHGAPNLRMLKFIDVEFKAFDSDDEPTRGTTDIFSSVVLGALEELTLQELGVHALRIILNFLAALNLQLLSCNKVNSIRYFIDDTQLKTLLSKLQRLTFQSTCPPPGESVAWIWKMYLIMPHITSIHFDSASRTLARPLGSRIKRLWKTLPALSEISVSGFAGDDIIELVKERRDQGVPVEVVRIDRRSIVSGAVALKHWEVLRGLVDTLSWFDAEMMT